MGELSLPEGQYEYKVYDNDDLLCEQGMMYVFPGTIPETKSYDETVIKKVYEG